MNWYRGAASAIIQAPAEQVYGLLADYRHAHATILPSNYVAQVTVKQGGYGAGTIVDMQMNLPGGRQTVRAIVTEPVPGRVLAETNVSTGQRITFSFEPLPNGQQSRVTITIHGRTASGVTGLIERLVKPWLAWFIAGQALSRLDDYISSQTIWLAELAKA